MYWTISEEQAQENFDAVLDWVRTSGDYVIIESDGERPVVIMPYKKYELLKASADQNAGQVDQDVTRLS